MQGSTDPWHAEAMRSRTESPKRRWNGDKTEGWDMYNTDKDFPEVPNWPLPGGKPTVHQPAVPSTQNKGLNVGLRPGDLEFGPSDRYTPQENIPMDDTRPSADANPPGPSTIPPPDGSSLPPQPPEQDSTLTAALHAVMAKLEQQQKGFDEWKANTLSELKDAAHPVVHHVLLVCIRRYYPASRRKNHRHHNRPKQRPQFCPTSWPLMYMKR